MINLGAMSNLALIGLAVVVAFWIAILGVLLFLFFRYVPIKKRKIYKEHRNQDIGFEWVDWEKVNR